MWSESSPSLPLDFFSEKRAYLRQVYLYLDENTMVFNNQPGYISRPEYNIRLNLFGML